MPNVTVVRRLQFNAAHRVHNPALSDAENKTLFGKCNNPNWHGHNYTLDVSVTGPIEERTGYVIDLAVVKRVVTREVIDKVDHRNLNLEVDFLRAVQAELEVDDRRELSVGERRHGLRMAKVRVVGLRRQLLLQRLGDDERRRDEGQRRLPDVPHDALLEAQVGGR